MGLGPLVIADDVLEVLDQPLRQYLFAELQRAVFVRIQNVANYFYMGTDQEHWTQHWTPRDFPNVAPPWPRFWLEYKTPAYAWTKEQGRVPPAPMRWGMMVVGYDRDNSRTGDCAVTFNEVQARAMTLLKDAQAAPWARPEDRGRNIAACEQARWFLTVSYFSPDTTPAHTATQIMPVLPDGSSSCDGLLTLPDYRLRLAGGQTARPSLRGAYGLLEHGPRNVLCLALSLCHSRNVTVVAEEVSKPLRRKRARRQRAPVSRFYTLKIEPLERIQRLPQRGQDGGGHGAPLHLRRGHWKDYRDSGTGLFGKWKGLWFWPMMARGSGRRGEIRKDYEIGSGK